ncbi:pathogenesis-related protein PR-1-like [Dioscorea cayenensis subsp. rotundata]|uniref:Pathogenesis-related protein PR-1-like n=1 Tax=Dioscorea cayennensis subsp. rotundata TaxID=55577 RepID=A0AB40BUX3_DIOCR|nr:pathogenesis-related protein PR-1-like [Dioscorea cayenensis subsp. rotundata]
MESLSFPSCNKLLVFLLYVSSMFIKSSSSTNLVTKSSIINVDKTKPASTRAQFMASHNAARQVVGVPPLVWDTGLTTFARVYANQRRKDCSLIHSPGYAYGENIFWGKGRRWSATDVVASWVAEKQWYHYNNNSCSGPDCTHYTQIVWRTTERVGCAKIVCDSGDTFAICEYYPPGNYIGARPYAQPEQKP